MLSISTRHYHKYYNEHQHCHPEHYHLLLPSLLAPQIILFVRYIICGAPVGSAHRLSSIIRHLIVRMIQAHLLSATSEVAVLEVTLVISRLLAERIYSAHASCRSPPQGVLTINDASAIWVRLYLLLIHGDHH